MLRITVSDSAGSICFGVEGSLTQPWANELKTCWKEVAGSAPFRSGCVDLTAMVNIDHTGKEVLTEMYRSGVRLIGSGIMTRAVISEIMHSR
jgi:hypothetical protein